MPFTLVPADQPTLLESLALQSKRLGAVHYLIVEVKEQDRLPLSRQKVLNRTRFT